MVTVHKKKYWRESLFTETALDACRGSCESLAEYWSEGMSEEAAWARRNF